MERIQQLKERYARYEQEAQAVRQKAAPLAGLWGWGDDPRNDPCHSRFYDEVGALAGELAQAEEAVVFEAVRWLLSAPEHCECADAQWFEYAAQGHCRALIPRLSREHRALLLEYFDAQYPKRERLPVQAEIGKFLARGR